MATAQTIINRSLRTLGVLASGDSATAAELSDALDTLNSTIDGWYADPKFHFTEQEESLTLSASRANYCIGNALLSLTSLTVATVTATATTIIPHGLVTGNKITVSGADGVDAAKLNITAAITVVSSTVFTYPIASSTVNGGTAAVCTAGDLYTDRPIRIMGSFTRLASVDSPLSIISERFWDGISTKSATSATQTSLLYRPNYPFGQIIVYPVPTGTPVLYIKSEKAIGQYSSLTENRLLPPGYLKMLELGLAIELSSEYNGKVSELVIGSIKQSFQSIVDINTSKIQSSRLGA